MNSTEYANRLFRLSRASSRFLKAHERNPESASLKTLLDDAGVQMEALFNAGASIEEVARVAGVR